MTSKCKAKITLNSDLSTFRPRWVFEDAPHINKYYVFNRLAYI